MDVIESEIVSKTRKVFVDCECGHAHMVVGYWDDMRRFYFSSWIRSTESTRLTLREAITISFRALFKRQLHEDDIIIDEKQARELAGFLANAPIEQPAAPAAESEEK